MMSRLILWSNSVPPWVAFLMIVLVYEIFAIGVSLLARRLYSRWNFPNSGSFVPPWISIVGGLNALIFAFVIVTLWSNLHAASADVDTEALSVRRLWRDIAPLSDPGIGLLAHCREGLVDVVRRPG